jgi:hypothetical protein
MKYQKSLVESVREHPSLRGYRRHISPSDTLIVECRALADMSTETTLVKRNTAPEGMLREGEGNHPNGTYSLTRCGSWVVSILKEQ